MSSMHDASSSPHMPPSVNQTGEGRSEQITICINGVERQIAAGLTVAELLTELRLSGDGIAVAVNDGIVVRSAHQTLSVQAGDRLEIVHAVAGG